MAHYAFLDSENVVTFVIPGVDEWETIEGKTPEEWYGNFIGQLCKRTSYNTHAGEHSGSGVPFRLNYAGVGFLYREDIDAFIHPQPFDSWILDETTGVWHAPIPYPDDGHMYEWNEDLQSWIEES